MKKITKILITASLLASSGLYADNTVRNYGLGSYKLGVSNASYNGAGTSGSKIYTGLDYFGRDLYRGIHLGLGADCVELNGSNYTLGGQVKVGYSLQELTGWNAGIKADVGYGYTTGLLGNKWGVQYGASFDTEIYKRFGVGYTFKHVDTGISNVTYNANIVYMAVMF